ncbi:MAG: RNA polymerase subunit sigma, partial [Planctomycetota bacterium]
ADQSRAEIASVLEINERTVRRHFAYAEAWLHRRLEAGAD